MAKQCIYPLPVYEAHFADGTIGRVSFWSEAGKSIDWARGRRIAALLYARPNIDGDALKSASREANAASFFGTYPPKEVMTGYGCHETVPGGRWPHIPEQDDPAPRKPSAAKVVALARKALELGNAAEALAILQQAA